jgi:hypothetical protein
MRLLPGSPKTRADALLVATDPLFHARAAQTSVSASTAALATTLNFPLVIEALARLRSHSCIIDGEAVACGDDGTALFDRIR